MIKLMSDTPFTKLQVVTARWRAASGDAASKAAILFSLLLVLLSGCEGDPRPFEEAVLANQLQLTSLTVDAAGADVLPLFVNPGRQLQFSVSGSSSSGLPLAIDGENRRWSSSVSSVGSITDSGLFNALSDGVTVVQVRIGGIDSEPFEVNVSTATLTAVTEIQGQAELSSCSAATYTATGTFSDGSDRALREISWQLDPVQSGAAGSNSSLSQATGAQVEVQARAPDNFSLVASQDGFSLALPITVLDDLQSIQIDGVPAELSNNETVSLNASAVTITDATVTTRNVTDIVVWRINANSAIAQITNGIDGGELTGLTAGTGMVEAICGERLATAPLVVNEDNFFGLSVSPSGAQTIAIGQTLVFTATATRDGETEVEDVTESVRWTISDPDDAAELDVDGDEVEVTGRRSGEATLVARFANTSVEVVITVQ